jgi:hypothetical protein
MKRETTKQVFKLSDQHTNVEVSITKRAKNPTIIEFTSFDTNHYLIVENGEFTELLNILTFIKNEVL